MGSTLAGSRTWLDSRYRESGLPLPAFRWVQRKDARAGTSGPGDALLLQDADLRLYLLLLELDPALSPEAMAQQVHRALCRFLASLLSLYEAQGRPFTLVLLLNQEDRAVDAARETGHGLILLGWTGRQEDATLHRVGIFGEGVRSPQPEDLFPATGS